MYCHVRDTIDTRSNQSIETKLSLAFMWALTCCFNVFLELETTVLMSTVDCIVCLCMPVYEDDLS